MHVHFFQEEAMTVIEGRLGYERKGEGVKVAEAGETVVFEAGVIHRFWNAGENVLHCTGYISPAESIEYFLGGIFQAQKKSGQARPDLFESAFLIRKYRREFEMDEIPRFIQQLVFPIVVGIGTLMGKYKKFSDAPMSPRT